MINDERENTSPIGSSANPDATVITEISSVQSVAQRCVEGTSPVRPPLPSAAAAILSSISSNHRS